MESRYLLVAAMTVAGIASCSTAGGSRAVSPATCAAQVDGGLRAFTPPDRSKLGGGQLLLTASGEALAEQGYNFPDLPANGVFADGWEVRFSHFVATLDKITVSSDPDRVPTDQSQTGDAVAIACGPWAVDLARATPGDVPGKEQGATATPIAVITSQNLVSGSPPFATDGTAYAVGFSVVAAAPGAINVNLDAEGVSLYELMVSRGCSVLYAGRATFKADPTRCTTQDAELSRLPPVVDFSLCFRSPTDYVNCDNQDVSGVPFGDEPYPRGVVFKASGYVTGEVTLHTDHPFWESVVHDTPAHFDQLAARVAAVAGDGGVPLVTMDDLVGADYLAYSDELGNPVPWRSCVKDATGAPYGKSSGRMSFAPQSVPRAPAGPSPTSAGLRDYYDLATYNQSTQGHWNGSDGLCFVKRNYPSPR
jgi:hypothetical protein